MNLPKFPIYTLALVFLVLISCNSETSDNQSDSPFKKVSEYDYKVVHDWNEVFLQIEKNAAGYRPGPAPRAVAYLGLSAYESVLPGMPSFNSFEGYWTGFSVPDIQSDKEYCWPLVVSASYAYLLPRFFGKATPEQLSLIQSTARRIEAQYRSTISDEVFQRSINRGQVVAEAVWLWSATDKVGHDHYLDPFQGYDWEDKYEKKGDWQPTFPGPGAAMGGIWGGARTFAIKNEQKLCRTPIPYSEDPRSHLYAQAIEVYSQNTPTLSYEAEWVGEFWSDDLLNLTFSPGVRFLAIGDQALAQEESNLETAVWMTALVGLASNDAGVGCWH